MHIHLFIGAAVAHVLTWIVSNSVDSRLEYSENGRVFGKDERNPSATPVITNTNSKVSILSIGGGKLYTVPGNSMTKLRRGARAWRKYDAFGFILLVGSNDPAPDHQQ